MQSNMKYIVAAIVLFQIVTFCLGPLLTIWSLNSLGLDIPVSFGTWCAVFWLMLLFGKSSIRLKKGDNNE